MILRSKEQGVSSEPWARGALPGYNMPQNWAGIGLSATTEKSINLLTSI